MFTGTWKIVESRDLGEDYLGLGEERCVKLRKSGKRIDGEYAYGVSSGQIDGRRHGDEMLFSFEGMDEITITMRFDDDSMATNILSVNTKPTKHECSIFGPKGHIDVVQLGGHIPGQLVGVFTGDLLVNGKVVKSDAPSFHQFATQMREFIAAISERRQPVVTYSQMLTQMAIIDAAKQSAASHQPVTLDL